MFRKDLAPFKTNKQILLFVTLKALSCQSQSGVKRKRFYPPRKSCQCCSSLLLLMPSNSRKKQQSRDADWFCHTETDILELGKMDVRLFLLCPRVFVLSLPDGTAPTEVSDRPHPDLRGKKLHQRLI